MPIGPVMLDLAGKALTAEDRELLQHPAVGGVILFTRNYHDPKQLLALTTAIRALRDPHLLIATDHEGGRVQRFLAGFKHLPPASYYGELYQNTPEIAQQTAQMMGWLMASELQSVGIDYSFAPVLDIDFKINQAIGNRSFSENIDTIMALTTSWLQGVRLAGMISVGKHFPGHGGVVADSHQVLPRDNRDFSTLWKQDIQPFQHLINQGIEAIMPAHVVYSTLDEKPAGFSSYWLREILRKRMGFQGVIISDALDMNAAAVAGNDVERAKTALLAGCDQLLVCNNRKAATQVVESLENYQDPAAQSRLIRLYGRHFTNKQTLTKNPNWQSAYEILQQFEKTQQTDLTSDPTTRGGKII